MSLYALLQWNDKKKKRRKKRGRNKGSECEWENEQSMYSGKKIDLLAIRFQQLSQKKILLAEFQWRSAFGSYQIQQFRPCQAIGTLSAEVDEVFGCWHQKHRLAGVSEFLPFNACGPVFFSTEFSTYAIAHTWSYCHSYTLSANSVSQSLFRHRLYYGNRISQRDLINAALN